jgi:hypothetical protein
MKIQKLESTLHIRNFEHEPILKRHYFLRTVNKSCHAFWHLRKKRKKKFSSTFAPWEKDKLIFKRHPKVSKELHLT